MQARPGWEEGPPGAAQAGGWQEAASWGPPVGWVSLLLGEGLSLNRPGQEWKPWLGDLGAPKP